MDDTTYKLPKTVWNDKDFEQMGWHDSKVYAIAFNEEEEELMLDIDYILQWISPKESKYYSFYISPATLLFSSVTNIVVDIENAISLEIEDITLEEFEEAVEDNLHKKKWSIELSSGVISFLALSFSQYIRRTPIVCEEQNLTFAQRGGISFSREYIS